MNENYSRQALIAFLDYLADKGLMNKNTVAGRKAAANALLGILDEKEAEDVRSVDLENLVQRFHNLKGEEFTPASLRVYKSRLNSTIEDFKKFKNNPLSFKPKISTSARPTLSPSTGRTSTAQTQKNQHKQDRISGSITGQYEDMIFPIPVRSGVVVRIAGMPSDLTTKEARKIANVILALAQVDDDKDD